MSDAPSKSFTSNKLDLQHRICADRRVTDGQFRMFVRVLAALRASDGKSALAIIGDETIMAEVPSCTSRSTCKANRKRLQDLGYWTVTPGHGKTATEYLVNLDANKTLQAGLDEARLVRIERRRRSRIAWRQRKAEGHTESPLPDDGDGFAHDRPLAHGDGYAAGPLHGSDRCDPNGKGDGRLHSRGDGFLRSRETAGCNPLYTFNTPSFSSPSYRATEESRYLEGDHVDSDGVIIPRNFLSRLGAGDIEEGRRLADHVPADRLSMLLDRSSKFGMSSCGAEIDNARKQALAAIARRASA